MGLKGFLRNAASQAQPSDYWSYAGVAATGDTGVIDVVKAELVGVDINITAISGGSVIFTYERQGADGIWYPLWTSSAISATGKQSATIGAGCAINQTVGVAGRVRWTVSGATLTFTVNVISQ